MNFVLGVVVLLVLVLSQGRLGSTTIADFSDGAKSAETLQTGDTILQVDGKPCWTIYTLADVFDGTEKTHTMKVLRGGEVVTLPPSQSAPLLNEDGSVSYATVSAWQRRNSAYTASPSSPGRCSAITAGPSWAASGSCSPAGRHGGTVRPHGTVSAVSQAVRYGWRDVLSLMALLTINVGISTCCPSRRWTAASCSSSRGRGLTGHPVPDSVHGFVNTAGMVALVWLMVLVTLQDLTRFL